MTKSRTSIQPPTYDEVLGDPDLREIIEGRIKWRFGDMCVLAEKDIQAMASQCSAEDMLKLGITSFETIIEKELSAFVKEWDKYRQRYGSCYLEEIKAARDGNDRLLKRLLAQDKDWLGRGWVLTRVMQTQRMGAYDLLKDFADSIGKQPKTGTKPKDPGDSRLILFLKAFTDFFGYGHKEIYAEEYLKPLRGAHDFLPERGLLRDQLCALLGAQPER